jgi:agmatinase
VNGVTEGLSGPIRRASEMDHIGDIYQIGLRSAGSARPEEVEAARDYGSHLITDIELQEIGMAAVLERVSKSPVVARVSKSLVVARVTTA